MNGKNPREQLAFVQAVTELFRFLEAEYGYQQSHADPTLVVYKSRDLEVHVCHDLLSYEVEFSIAGGNGPKKWRYALPEILRGLAPEYRGKGFYQTTDRELLRESLADIAALVRQYGEGLVRGDKDAVRRIEMAEREQRREATEYYTISPVKEKADIAWKKRNYAEVVALYGSIESHLSSLERQRLDYAKKHVTDSE